MGTQHWSPLGKIQGGRKTFPYLENGIMHQRNSTCMQLNWLYVEFTNLSEYPHKTQCVWLLRIPSFYPFLHMEKPFHIMENHGLIRSKNSTKYLNLGFLNSFSKLRYIWWNTGTSLVTFSSISTYGIGKLPLTTNPFNTWKSGISVTISVISVTIQSFPLNLSLTAVTNFLYLSTMAQSVHWLHLDTFPPMENSLPLTTNAFHTWKNGKFSVISTAVTNFLYPLQWHIVSTDSIWMAFHLWKTPFHWSQTPSTQQHMHDSSKFVVNLFHSRNIVEGSVIG